MNAGPAQLLAQSAHMSVNCTSGTVAVVAPYLLKQYITVLYAPLPAGKKRQQFEFSVGKLQYLSVNLYLMAALVNNEAIEMVGGITFSLAASFLRNTALIRKINSRILKGLVT